MRPQLKLLDEALITRIVDEARDILATLGVKVQNPLARELLGEHGARVESDQVFLDGPLIDRALETSPATVQLYDTTGELALDLGGDRVHFTPGSAAIKILDPATQQLRQPSTADYVRYTRVVAGLPGLASQSTCMVPADVPEMMSDSYRLYLSLKLGEKPVVTGCFTAKAFAVMQDLQLAVRGSAEALAAKPLCIFSACPTSPLKWSDVTSQNVIDCAQAGVPVEFISMPLSGFMAPVTLVGSLIAHTAETLSGVVLSQCARAGAPMLYGGSPAAFDIRYETTPMGAVETQMIDAAYAQIGKWLGLPTQAYIGLSDAKRLDAQAGLETSMGATLAALAGINNISGPGMLDFESSFSIEKLVVDHEICQLALRLARGIEPREDFPARPHFEELIKEGHLLIARHTRKHLRDELHYPGPVIDRMNSDRYLAEGAQTLEQRTAAEIERLLAEYTPPRLSAEQQDGLDEIMSAEARRRGLDLLPALDL